MPCPELPRPLRFRQSYVRLAAVTGLFVVLIAAPAAKPVSVFIVAGQSNMLNWHANADELPPDPQDASIRFWHASGAPPLQPGFTVTVNASSHGQWITLGPQHQIPFVKYNPNFFGPEITLGRNLARTRAVPIAIIKIGYFGTSLAEDWAPRATTGNQLYAALLDQVRTAIGQLEAPAHLAGLCWMQGETDAANPDHAAAYAAHLTAFLTALREDLPAPDLPVVLARIGPPPGGKYVWQEDVRAAQTAITAAPSRTAWVNTDDLPRDTDGIHLLAPGVIILGQRFADAWSKLADDSPVSPTP